MLLHTTQVRHNHFIPSAIRIFKTQTNLVLLLPDFFIFFFFQFHHRSYPPNIQPVLSKGSSFIKTKRVDGTGNVYSSWTDAVDTAAAHSSLRENNSTCHGGRKCGRNNDCNEVKGSDNTIFNTGFIWYLVYYNTHIQLYSNSMIQYFSYWMIANINNWGMIANISHFLIK